MSSISNIDNKTNDKTVNLNNNHNNKIVNLDNKDILKEEKKERQFDKQ